MGPASGKPKDVDAVRFYYDRVKVVEAFWGPFRRGHRAIAGLLAFVLLFILALISVFYITEGGWKSWPGMLMGAAGGSIPAFIIVKVYFDEKHALEELIDELGPDESLYLEIDNEGLRIPAGLAMLDDIEDHRHWMSQIVPVPLPEVIWAYIGIGHGMEKGLVLHTMHTVQPFMTNDLAIDPSNLKEPVESLADALMSRGVVVKVVWCRDSPYGHEFRGFRPYGVSGRKVAAVVDHEKGRIYEQRDRHKILPREKVQVAVAK